MPSGVTVNNPFNAFYPVSGGGDSSLNTATASALSEAGVNVSGTTSYKWGAGPHASDNQGVFRIYWSPKSSAKALQSDLSGYFKGSAPHTGTFSGVLGPAYQTFAQGYNCSAPLSAIAITDSGGDVITSGTYPDLVKLSACLTSQHHLLLLTLETLVLG